jgi:hypothetical protein
MLPDVEAFVAGFAAVVVGFATVAAGTGAASGLVVGDAGDGGNDFAGTVSAPLVSLATLTAGVGTEGAVTVTAGVGVAVSVAGGFVETTDAAGGGQRWP